MLCVSVHSATVGQNTTSYLALFISKQYAFSSRPSLERYYPQHT